jgi:hypothetical protein
MTTVKEIVPNEYLFTRYKQKIAELWPRYKNTRMPNRTFAEHVNMVIFQYQRDSAVENISRE